MKRYEPYLINPPKGKKKMAKRKRATKRRVTRLVHHNSPLMLMNPPKRRKATRRRKNRAVAAVRRRVTSARKYVAKRVKRYRKSGVSKAFRGGIMGNAVSLIKEAGMITLGAVACNEVVKRVLPAQYQTGAIGYAAKGAVAVAGGYAISRFLKQPKLAHSFALGGMVAVMSAVVKEYANLSALGMDTYYAPLNSYYAPAPVSEGVSGQPDFLGFEQNLPDRFGQRF